MVALQDFPHASLLLPSVTASDSETPCVCAVPSDQPKSLAIDFCSQNLLLSSGIAFRSDCQMTGRGSNLDSNLNSAFWPTSCMALMLWNPWINCVEFEFFSGLLKMPKLRQGMSCFQPSCPRLPVRPAHAVLEHCPKSLVIDFAVKSWLKTFC